MYDIDNEPPAHVQAVKAQGEHYFRDYLVRQPGGWRLSGDPEGRDTVGTVRPWREATRISFQGENGGKFEAVKTDPFKPGDKVRGRATLHDREVTGTVANPAYFTSAFDSRDTRLRVLEKGDEDYLTHVDPETATLIEDENPHTEEEITAMSQTPALVGPKPEVKAPAFVTPLTVSGSTIFDADDNYVTNISGDLTESEQDEALAEIIVEFLNEKFGA